MRARPSRQGVALTAALAATAILAGCGPAQPGAAAVVGDQRVSNADIQADLAEVRELYAAYGAPANEQELAGQASQLVSLHVDTLILEEVAAANDIALDADEVAGAVVDLGGPEGLAQQGVLLASEVDLVAKATLVGAGLVEREPAANLAALEDTVTDGLRAELAQQGALLGLDGDDLDDFVDTGVDQQEENITEVVSSELLGQHYNETRAGTDIEISPRYGTVDPASGQLVPGASELSASEPLAVDELPFPMGE